MAVSKRLRYEILRRDSHTCRYCGASAPDVPLRVDHVTAVALGGADTPDNLVTSCEPCNSGKSSMPADAALVSNVADSALHWAAAIKQAAEELRAQTEPKRAYRDTFQQAWNEWTWEHNGKREPHEMEDGWKSSIDNFREAGLPVEAWPDIIEKAMTNKMVKAENLFRYSCGIGWRMVRELQDRAKEIAGRTDDNAEPLDPIVVAALKVWTDERDKPATDEERARIQETAAAVLKREDAYRVIQGAQYAAWFGMTGVNDALVERDMDHVMNKWTMCWLSKTGEWPDDKHTERVREQCDALFSHGVYVERIAQAASYAGARRSIHLHFGLSEEELKATKRSAETAKAAEVWSQSFHAATGRWPDGDEVSAFFTNLWRVGHDGDMWIEDIYPAAAAAGLYQDPDFSTCITRHLSVFEIAARPMGGVS